MPAPQQLWGYRWHTQSRLRGLPGAVLTPHIAWTTKEALQRLMDITTGNLRSFLAGKGENIVNS